MWPPGNPGRKDQFAIIFISFFKLSSYNISLAPTVKGQMSSMFGMLPLVMSPHVPNFGGGVFHRNITILHASPLTRAPSAVGLCPSEQRRALTWVSEQVVVMRPKHIPQGVFPVTLVLGFFFPPRVMALQHDCSRSWIPGHHCALCNLGTSLIMQVNRMAWLVPQQMFG